MHLSENQLKTYLDRQMSQEDAGQTLAHLEHCARCAARLTQLGALTARTATTLSAVQAPRMEINTQRALHRLQNRPKESYMKNFTKKPVFAGLLVMLAVLVSLAFPPVRAFASDVLALFRVDQVQVVTYDPAYMQQFISGTENSRGEFEAFFNENITESRQGTFQTVDTKADAEALAGFLPRLPRLDDGTLGVEPGSEIAVTLDTNLINTMLTELGYESYAISDDFNGKKVSVHVPVSVVYTSGQCSARADASDPDDPSRLNCVTLVQMRAPQADAPEGLDVAHLGEALFQIMGMTQTEAEKLSQSIDWSTTLVLPVPVGGGVQYQDVIVDGVQGSYIVESESSLQTLIWSKNGMLYAINSTQPGLDILDLANNLQ